MLSEKTKALVGVIVAGWLVVLMGLIAFNATRAEAAITGDLESSIEQVEEMDLHGTSLAPLDIWGENISAVMPVCPGVTEDNIAQLGVDPALFAFENGAIPEHSNYMLVLPTQGQPIAEKYFRKDIDLCGQLQSAQPINPAALVTFIKDSNDTWLMVG